MNMKLEQKITKLVKLVAKIFVTTDIENALNDSRKAGEALCKVLILEKFGESVGQDIILGKIIKGVVIQKPKKLDFNGLINIVINNESNFQLISDYSTREKLGLYLNTIRTHGNLGSHEHDEPVKYQHLDITKNALSLALLWLFQEHLKKTIPHQIKGCLESTDSLTVTKAELTLLEQFQENLHDWFVALGYEFGAVTIEDDEHFEFIIKLQERRKTIDVLIYGITDEIKIGHYDDVGKLVKHYDCEEGWIITTYKVSKAVIQKTENNQKGDVLCYNFDELIEENINLVKYFDWVKEEVAAKKIDQQYIQIGCEKVEINQRTKEFVAKNTYTAEDGFTEGYLNSWLIEQLKEHISILGEFGTGKTWLTLHYTWHMIKQYEEAKIQKLSRPRIPILIQLRDFAKAVNVESLISDFFFRKHQIEIKGVFAAFMQLNKMGKLLLIFDGFDEMADKVNKQKMIDNFWELASIITGNSKIILTCRSEHFPQIKEGRSLLRAELKDSTKPLTGKSPQFEVLQLLKFNNDQIRTLLGFYTDKATIKKILSNESIRDLLCRPIMSELVIDALKDIEEGKPIDMARVYLYATKRKMERDIKDSRTFTSLADKLYFMCELSWEMVANDKLKIHFKEFHHLTERLFGYKTEEQELDYWRYDMRGQTMLIIDEEDGYYKPAHKSFLEFFVALKFAAELGVLYWILFENYTFLG